MTMQRLVCCVLFLLANVGYIALVATEVADPALAGAYFAAALVWSMRLRYYRRRDHRGPHR